MKRLRNLAVFGLIIILLMAGYYGICQHFFRIVLKQQEVCDREVEEAQLEAVISVFYAHYHKWPAPSGPLSDQVITELGGFSDASINTEHINFLHKMGYSMPLWHGLYFRYDDASGTCLVYEQK